MTKGYGTTRRGVLETWEHNGFKCCVVLTPSKTVNGYILLPPDHAYSGIHYEEIEKDDIIKVRGDFIYSSRGGPLKKNRLWCLGFTTAYHGKSVPTLYRGGHRRLVGEVKAETNRLTEQLSRINRNLLVMERSRGKNRHKTFGKYL